MKSPYGRRGSICAHFGWTWDYLHHGIAWAIVQRMLADAPSIYDDDDDDKKGGDLARKEITNDELSEIVKKINS